MPPGNRGTMFTRDTFRLRLALPLAATLAAWGCDRPTATEPEAPVLEPATISASQAARDGKLPLHIRADANLLAQELAPDFGPPLFGRSDFGGRCSQPADFVIRFALEGRATHLGHFTALAEHCSHIDWTVGDTNVRDGLMTLTAANGDELWGSYAGDPAPGGGTAETMVLTGGTGRFAAASGEGVSHVMCDRQAGTCVYALDGWITYDAADRR